MVVFAGVCAALCATGRLSLRPYGFTCGGFAGGSPVAALRAALVSPRAVARGGPAGDGPYGFTCGGFTGGGPALVVISRRFCPRLGQGGGLVGASSSSPAARACGREFLCRAPRGARVPARVRAAVRLEPAPTGSPAAASTRGKFRQQHPTLDGEVRGDEMLSWLYLLTEGYKDEEAVRSMVEFIPTVERFAQAYGLALDDPDIKHAYDQYVSSVMTENNILRRERREGFEDGHARGRTEGRAEGIESLASRLRAAGVDPALLDAALAAETAGE